MEELILKERNFKEDMVKIINTSGLPAFVIKPTLKELLEQVVLLEQEQYKMAKESETEQENSKDIVEEQENKNEEQEE